VVKNGRCKSLAALCLQTHSCVATLLRQGEIKNPRNVARLVVRLFFCIVLSELAHGATLSFSPSGIPSPIQHSFYVDGRGYDEQSFTLPTPSVYLRNYDAIQFSVQAPSGKAWFVDTDPSFSIQRPYAALAYNNSPALGSPFAAISSATIQFDFVQGGPANYSTIYHEEFISDTGDKFELNQNLSLNGDIAFTGFTMTVQFDNSFMADASLLPFEYAYFDFFYLAPSGTSDPGPHMTLAAIPEPSIAALSLFGAMALLMRRALLLHCLRLRLVPDPVFGRLANARRVRPDDTGEIEERCVAVHEEQRGDKFAALAGNFVARDVSGPAAGVVPEVILQIVRAIMLPINHL